MGYNAGSINDNKNIDMIFIVETWLKNGTINLKNKKFRVYGKGINSNKGVMIIVSKKYNTRLINKEFLSECLICIEVKSKDNKSSIIAISTYFPPNTDEKKIAFHNLISLLQKSKENTNMQI
mgnify:CR=1 FL=1